MAQLTFSVTEDVVTALDAYLAHMRSTMPGQRVTRSDAVRRLILEAGQRVVAAAANPYPPPVMAEPGQSPDFLANLAKRR